MPARKVELCKLPYLEASISKSEQEAVFNFLVCILSLFGIVEFGRTLRCKLEMRLGQIAPLCDGRPPVYSPVSTLLHPGPERVLLPPDEGVMVICVLIISCMAET